MRQTQWSRTRGQKQREQRSLGHCWQWKAYRQRSKADNCSFRHDINKRAKSTQPNPSTQQNVKNAREPRVLEAEAQVGKWLDCRARITSNELAPLHSVKNGILRRSACSTSPKMDAHLEEKCSYAHRQVDEQPSKKSKKNGDKIAVAILKNTRQLGCVFQIWSRRSLHRFCGRAQTY